MQLRMQQYFPGEICRSSGAVSSERERESQTHRQRNARGEGALALATGKATFVEIGFGPCLRSQAFILP